jgi:FMN reductase
MTETRNIVVVTAGLSDPSSTRLLADLLARAVESTQSSATVTTDVVELRPLAHALADNMLTGFATGELAEAQQKVADADGLIVVTPVFSASYSGLFKMFFDVLEQGALDGTPVLVAATAGTARHSLVLEHALRPLFSYLHAAVVPTGVFAASEDWGSGGNGSNELHARIKRAAGELVAAVTSRPAAARLDQFDRDLVEMGDFESLLNR